MKTLQRIRKRQGRCYELAGRVMLNEDGSETFTLVHGVVSSGFAWWRIGHALEIESAKIAETLPALTEAENAELIALLAAEDAKLDRDVAALQAEAARLATEAAAARNIKPLSVPLSKAASRILQNEITRRLADGYCPGLAILTETAIRRAYAYGD
jgi:hypothetical protein